jgi:cytochrome c peroxidase
MASVRAIVTSSIVVFGISTAWAADDTTLRREAQQIFQPFPKDMSTLEAPVTKERVILGRLLFFDPRITVDGNVSCATCHQPALYGTDGRSTSIGVRQRPHPRNAPTILNAALDFVNHWRGDRASVEDQAEQALTARITSGLDERGVIDRLRLIGGYSTFFKAAFPDDTDPITILNMAKAIGAYERTLVTPAPFDAYLAGDVNAISPLARAGLQTFIKSGCAACHSGVGIGGGMYQKFGIVEDYWTVTGSQAIDKGRADVTGNPADLYVFRVSSLRNVAMTAPYFHDGSVATISEAVRIMARVQLGLKLSDTDVTEVVAFLDSLTGDVPLGFAAAPVLPPAAPTAP